MSALDVNCTAGSGVKQLLNHQLQWCPLEGDSGTVSGDVTDGVPLLFCDYIINKELIVKSGFLIPKKLWKLSIGVRKMLLRTG